jgi:acetyl-CoA C-acetyltransferase
VPKPNPPTLILDGLRTPIGSIGGALANLPAPQLGASCLAELLRRNDLPGDRVDEVLMGLVLAAGTGQNPARAAAMAAGLPPHVGATTLNKVCGSGLKTVLLADQAIRSGDARLVLAGGMESMSRAPFLLPRAREGHRLGHAELLDALLQDGLQDADSRTLMGALADHCAKHCRISRSDQDDYAIQSHQRAQDAFASGAFANEIVPVSVPQGKGRAVLITTDEGPNRFDESKLRTLPPAFGENGTVTAGNASRISDGAAALLLASPEAAEELGRPPLARIVASSTFSREPEWFTLAPIGALQAVLDRAGWPVDSVDLFEINEAFAVVALAIQRALNLPMEKVNIQGGAIALGHPLGASGARILVTLLHALHRQNAQRGIATLCIGGGEAIAIAIERV